MAIKNTIKLAMPLAAVMLWLGSPVAKAGSIGYNDIPTADTHLGHETTSFASVANNVSEFGSLIHSAAGNNVGQATVVMSNYATKAQYSGATLGDGYDVSLTLSLYNIDGSTGNEGSAPGQTFGVGSVIDSQTVNAHIAWRPSASAGPQTCGGTNENAYTDGSGTSCGQLNFVNFNFANTIVPTDFIWGLRIGTSQYGAGASLNWALNDGTDPESISLSSNPQAGTNYLNYNSLGFAGTTSFGAITDWGNAGQGEISFAPEPASFGLIGLGLVGLGFAARRKRGV